jgi:PAS domain-containing protein
MKVKGIEDEKILRESLARNQALLDALPDLMFILNKDGVYLDYKAGGNGDLYKAPNDFLGKRVDEVLPADLARLSIRYIKRALKSRHVETFEYQLEIEGELHDYECYMNAIDDSSVIAIVRDITKRRQLQKEISVHKQTEKELRTTREYLDTILLNMPAGLAILEGPEFKYFRINPELADINEVPVEEHLGRPLAEVLLQAAKDIVPVLQKILDTGESTQRREFCTRLPKDPDEILAAH